MDSEKTSGAEFENESIRVGDRFSSFVELEQAIRLLEQAQGITFWKRDSRTIQGSYKRAKGTHKRGKHRRINPVLKYQKVVWTCMKGGRTFVSRANGRSLHNARSFRSSCLACVKVTASKDGQSLVVVKAVLKHNHPPFKVLLPHRERLIIKQKMLKIRENQAVLLAEQGLDSEVRTAREPSEQVTQSSSPNRSLTQDSRLDHALAKLKHNAECIVEVLVDQDHILKGIFYQDTTMQRHFDLFPEVLVVSTACRLLDTHVYVQLAVDGNGHAELASVCVVRDSLETVSAMVDIFKRHNSAWEKIQLVVMTEHRMERLVYAAHYPKAQMLITPSRVSRTMMREISKMDALTDQQKQDSLQLLQQIAYSSGEQDYQENIERLHEMGIQPVVDYYNRTWHPIREHWVVGLKECCLYSQNTTRELARFQHKLNQCIHTLGDVRGFCRDAKWLVDSLRGVLREVAQAQLHVQVEVGERVLSGSAQRRYRDLLTPYACQLVTRQVGLSEQVEFAQAPAAAAGVAVLDSASGTVNVTATSCTCPFAMLNRLPCRHVFAFRAKCGLDLFSDEGVAPRWCLKHNCRRDLQEDLGGRKEGDIGESEEGDMDEEEKEDSGGEEQEFSGGEEQEFSGGEEQEFSGREEQEFSGGEEQEFSGGEEQGSSVHTVARRHRQAVHAAKALMLLACTPSSSSSSSSTALHEERIAVVQQLLHLWEEDKHAAVVELIQVTV